MCSTVLVNGMDEKETNELINWGRMDVYKVVSPAMHASSAFRIQTQSKEKYRTLRSFQNGKFRIK